ncbi:MAG: branched-chain amino acid aminotransferase [Bacteroidales bacterium]|nr:branched-chain amino acid aminotransferase [Bacteroidales bacterium]
MVDIDWGNLPFGYEKTNANTRCYYKDGKWGSVEVTTDETVTMHMSATCLHYGQECFEGLKAYRGKDGKIRVFRWEENAKRLNSSATRVGMPEVPAEIFKEMLFTLVKKNSDFVPPYGTGASLYIRPLMIGVSPRLGISASTEYILILFCSPVGPYYKGGFKPIKVIVERGSDRAAPLGTGTVKIGGNYAAALNMSIKCHEMGYGAALYLDPKEKKYIDECGPANFFAIKGDKYITPKSSSILPSITNMSLQALAEKIGLTVEKRQFPLIELAECDEAAECGTAAVISPISAVVDPDENITYTFGDQVNPGKTCVKLYETLVGIQYGDVEDPFGWISFVE